MNSYTIEFGGRKVVVYSDDDNLMLLLAQMNAAMGTRVKGAVVTELAPLWRATGRVVFDVECPNLLDGVTDWIPGGNP